jgi:hypothetical protein
VASATGPGELLRKVDSVRPHELSGEYSVPQPFGGGCAPAVPDGTTFGSGFAIDRQGVEFLEGRMEFGHQGVGQELFRAPRHRSSPPTGCFRCVVRFTITNVVRPPTGQRFGQSADDAKSARAAGPSA